MFSVNLGNSIKISLIDGKIDPTQENKSRISCFDYYLQGRLHLEQQVIEKFLQLGIDVNKKEKLGRTLLISVCEFECEGLEYLISKKADLNIKYDG